MDLSIRGSFEPYVYVAFWQLSLAGLQQIRLAQGFDQEKSRILKFYVTATYIVATAMNWMTWGLAIWIWASLRRCKGYRVHPAQFYHQYPHSFCASEPSRIFVADACLQRTRNADFRILYDGVSRTANTFLEILRGISCCKPSSNVRLQSKLRDA
jgi:hypothetical protein